MIADRFRYGEFAERALAVERLILADPGRSNRSIAREIDTNHSFVNRVRRELVEARILSADGARVEASGWEEFPPAPEGGSARGDEERQRRLDEKLAQISAEIIEEIVRADGPRYLGALL